MNRNKEKGRLAPFVPYLKETMREPAWRIMSLGARMLYLHLKARYSLQAKNNGRIYLPTRIAAEELGGSGLHQVGRWFRELQHYGFIVMTQGGYLGVEGKGRAPKWRLTELGYMNDPPTRDYSRWQGDLFVDEKPGRKKQNPDVENSIRVMSKTTSLVMQKTTSPSPASDVENSIKETTEVMSKAASNLVLTTRAGRAGSEQESGEATPVLSGLREWTTPHLEEIEYTDELRQLYRCEVVEAAETPPVPDVDQLVREVLQNLWPSEHTRAIG